MKLKDLLSIRGLNLWVTGGEFYKLAATALRKELLH